MDLTISALGRVMTGKTVILRHQSPRASRQYWRYTPASGGRIHTINGGGCHQQYSRNEELAVLRDALFYLLKLPPTVDLPIYDCYAGRLYQIGVGCVCGVRS
jgi:hypothetical protein